ncbi:MAG: OprO/OprP family phosphate-selective porin [Bdellovibrionaceae bacterium]|nr:OprO/OprP family phosphate-selective porin [Pseudobdellovibrionaceae bacterium]
MKLALLFVFVVPYAIAWNARASELNLELRGESDRTKVNEAGLASGLRNSHNFRIQTLRLDLTNKIDRLDYRLRVRFNRNLTDVGSKDSMGPFVDFAWIRHSFAPSWELTAGKVLSDLAAREGFTLGSEMYYTSAAFADASTKEASLFVTGAKLSWKPENHEVHLIVANNTAKGTTDGSLSGTQEQTRLFSGVQGRGKYLSDGNLQLVLSYHTASNAENSSPKDRRDVFWSGNVFYKFGPWRIDFDKHYFQYTNRSVDKVTDDLSSDVLNVLYEWDERLLIKFKGEASYAKTATSADNFSSTRTAGHGTALEYRPLGTSDFRYHVAWTSKSSITDGGSPVVEEHLILGFRLLHDLLK